MLPSVFKWDQTKGDGMYVDSPVRFNSVNRILLKEIEATLHCLMSIQEASPIEDHVDLRRLFSTEVLGSFPKSGSSRVRRTTVVLIGSNPYRLKNLLF